MQKAHRFRCYFTPLPGYFSPFPHGTSSLSVAKEYLALRGGPRGFRPGFPCPAVLRNFRSEAVQFRLRGLYPLRRAVPCTSPTTQLCNSPTRRQADQLKPYNPATTTAAAYHVVTVWALPFSLATTQGVEVSFLSSGYLDVSVPQLASAHPILFRCEYQRITTGGFPHSEIPGSKVGQHLPRAYRSRPRPSSALGAKASTVCPCSLDREEHRKFAAMEFSRCAWTARIPKDLIPKDLIPKDLI